MKLKSIIAVLLAALLTVGLSACGGGGEDVVYAQSLRSLNGTGPVGVADRFAGVTVSGRTKEIKKDPALTVEEVNVQEGQLVKAGDVLFTYNNESAALNLEQAKLEIESLKNKIETANSQISELTKERNAAASADKLGYTLEIQGLQADIKETQYNITVKEKALKALTDAAGDTQVKSDINGRVTEINTTGDMADDGSEKPFITIVEVGNLRVKGAINEMNRGALNEGDAVTIRSRTDDAQTWRGVIQSIDWENAEKNSQNGYAPEGGDEMTTSSRYPFYITVDDPDGLIIGQHVYIEPGEAVGTWTDQLMLPAYYINDVDGDPWVWAVNGRDRLEKRSVVLGDYDELTEEYAVTDGLTQEDYVAFPDETLKAGMKAEKTDSFAPMGGDEGLMDDGFADDGLWNGEAGFEGEEDFAGMGGDPASDGDGFAVEGDGFFGEDAAGAQNVPGGVLQEGDG